MRAAAGHVEAMWTVTSRLPRSVSNTRRSRHTPLCTHVEHRHGHLREVIIERHVRGFAADVLVVHDQPPRIHGRERLKQPQVEVGAGVVLAVRRPPCVEAARHPVERGIVGDEQVAGSSQQKSRLQVREAVEDGRGRVKQGFCAKPAILVSTPESSPYRTRLDPLPLRRGPIAGQLPQVILFQASGAVRSDEALHAPQSRWNLGFPVEVRVAVLAPSLTPASISRPSPLPSKERARRAIARPMPMLSTWCSSPHPSMKVKSATPRGRSAQECESPQTSTSLSARTSRGYDALARRGSRRQGTSG